MEQASKNGVGPTKVFTGFQDLWWRMKTQCVWIRHVFSHAQPTCTILTRQARAERRTMRRMSYSCFHTDVNLNSCKGIVHPYIIILSSFTHPHVILNLRAFLWNINSSTFFKIKGFIRNDFYCL